jgi:hypothetical protein
MNNILNKMLKWSATFQFVMTVSLLLLGYVANTMMWSMTMLCVFLIMEEFAKMCFEVYKNSRR